MAGKTIGSMTAVVRATAGQFDADLKQAGNSIKQFQNKVNNSGGSGGGLMGMFGGGASFAAGFAAVQTGIAAVTGTVQKFFSTIDNVENMQDFARQIGATTREITGLRFAAEIGGSSAEVMDAALQKMTQKLGEAREGSAETRVAFEALGLKLEDLAAMTTGEQLKAIADRFKEVKNPADQAAIAVDIFGKQGVNLVNVLNEGSDGINKMIDRGRELGVVLGTDAANEMSAASTVIKEMKAAWQGLWNQLTLAVLPTLKSIVSVLTDIISFGRKATQGVVSLFEPIAKRGAASPASPVAVETSESPLAQMKAAAKEADDAKKVMDDLFRQGESVTKSLRTEQEKYNASITDLKNLLDVGAIGWETFNRGVMQAASELEKAAAAKEEFDRVGMTPGVGSAQFGSSAAATAVNQSRRMQLDLARISANYDKRSAEGIEKSNRIQQQILQALENSGSRGVNI